ncbi:MAG: DUF2933 domain-containing protein [Actinomycetia bacterium]|nr:DUF2933 domain-containing protein [Actinomycetes bacterium]
MKRQDYGLYAIALAILVVGLAFVGVPAQMLVLGLVILVCPLMMMFMMGGHSGGHGHDGGDNTDEMQHEQRPTPGQL